MVCLGEDAAAAARGQRDAMATAMVCSMSCLVQAREPPESMTGWLLLLPNPVQQAALGCLNTRSDDARPVWTTRRADNICQRAWLQNWSSGLEQGRQGLPWRLASSSSAARGEGEASAASAPSRSSSCTASWATSWLRPSRRAELSIMVTHSRLHRSCHPSASGVQWPSWTLLMLSLAHAWPRV